MNDIRRKILLIEDDNLDRMAFERYVENKKLLYDYRTAKSVSQAKSMLSCEHFDVIVSDYFLGDGTAIDILNSVKHTPIILTTGAADEQVAIEAWRAGAYDYLPKDVDGNYLQAIPRTIENAISHKKTQEEVNRKQRNLEAMFDAVPVGMLLVDADRIVTHANDAIRQTFRREYAQIIGQRVGMALGCVNSAHDQRGCGHSRDCAGCSLRNAVDGVIESGRSIRGVEKRLTFRGEKEETTLWVRMSAEPVIVDDRRCAIVAIDDVTEHKKAEEERRVAEERYRTIFENSAVAITMADEHERLVSWNKFMEQLLGMDQEDLHLRPVRSLYPAEEWEKIRACNARQKGMQYHLETRMFRKDGGLLDVDISLSVLKDAEGNTTGSIGVIRDITVRKRAEETLKETMELKSQFISTVSHELRTPLTAVREGLGIVLDEVPGRINDKQRKFLDIAKRNTDRLSDLINDVLDFQRLEAGRMKLDIQSHDVREILCEVHETMALYAQKSHIELSCALAEDLPRAELDRAKIIQVLTNLISNGVKFTNEKGRVAVEVYRQNDELVMRVSDTGMGIPKEAIPKIFDRFYRVNRPGKQIQGTGLGLAIVQKIVMMHNGRIEVESEVNQGTTFTVFLPLNAKPPPEPSCAREDEILENATVG
jgi:PAS domain S-box-containing protein